MPTLTGFTRPSDPIVASDLASKISIDIGKTVTVAVTPTDVQVSGSTISGADMTTIQTSMSNYIYTALEYGVGLYADPDSTMVANSNVRIPTQKAILTAINSVNRKAWVTGALKPGSFVYYSKTTTVGGVATFYITDDGTATGNAVFSSVYADTMTVSPYGSAALYQVSAPTVSTDKKSITATINQVTSVVLGLITISAAANGVDCRLLVLGN